MGIQGLLPLLKSIHKPTHLRNFAGQTVGVDAYGWLHRGTVSCAIELAQHKPTRKHIDFALSRVRMLIHFGVKPYLVFDGAYLPSKEHTEKERAARRRESKKLGLELLSLGRVSQAHLELQKAVDVTPLMARELIEELKALHVPYVVAPYEADSQLAYLEKVGLISAVLSEDSDLLVFGVQCLLTKLDQYGECVMINRADFTACREVSLVGWTDKEFRMMAMLSGCDYLPGIDKMGLKTAYRLVRKHKVIDRLVRSVQFDGKMKVPAGYLEAFDHAEKTFLFQWIFCPKARRSLHLTDLPAGLESANMPYIGRGAEPEIAIAIAAGDLDPNTKEPLFIDKSASGARPGTRTRSLLTPDEKQGKPLSEFFKPRRTPLAELDPNSFTPSPSQQTLLQSQQGASWSASQVQPLQHPALTRVGSANGSSSAPQPSRRAISDHLLDPRRKSPKRQRLCSDSTIGAAMSGKPHQQNTESPFFSKQDAEPSPSLRRPSAQRKRAEDFELWSDDPAAEAVAEMMTVSEAMLGPTSASAKRPKKIKVYADGDSEIGPKEEAECPTGLEEVAVGDHSQETAITKSSESTQRSVEERTPLTSFETDDDAQTRNVFHKGIDADFAALRARYGFQSTTPRKQPTRTKSTPMSSKSPLQSADQNELLGRLAKHRNTSDKTNRGNIRACDEKDKEKELIAVPNSSPPQIASETLDVNPEAEDDHFICDDEWLEMERREASPGTTLAVQGSEDLLIPNSPDSTAEGECTKRPTLNLAHFAFTGR